MQTIIDTTTGTHHIMTKHYFGVPIDRKFKMACGALVSMDDGVSTTEWSADCPDCQATYSGEMYRRAQARAELENHADGTYRTRKGATEVYENGRMISQMWDED